MDVNICFIRSLRYLQCNQVCAAFEWIVMIGRPRIDAALKAMNELPEVAADPLDIAAVRAKQQEKMLQLSNEHKKVWVTLFAALIKLM